MQLTGVQIQDLRGGEKAQTQQRHGSGQPKVWSSVRARAAKCEFCSCCLLSIAKGWRWFPCHQSKILLPLNHPPCLGAASNAC